MNTTGRQEEQQEVLELALAAPGVREVIDVYGPIAPFTGTRVVTPRPRLSYSTGGNA